MLFKIDVEDSRGNFSMQQVEAVTLPEARQIARNLHIREMKYDGKLIPYPTIWTFIEEETKHA